MCSLPRHVFSLVLDSGLGPICLWEVPDAFWGGLPADLRQGFSESEALVGLGVVSASVSAVQPVPACVEKSSLAAQIPSWERVGNSAKAHFLDGKVQSEVGPEARVKMSPAAALQGQPACHLRPW